MSTPRSRRQLFQFAKGMREQRTTAEWRMLGLLWRSFSDEPVLNQVLLGHYILDYVLPKRLVLIEVDGPSHNHRKSYDARRDVFCKECGLRIYRVTNKRVLLEDPLIVEELRVFGCQPNWELRFRAALKMAGRLLKGNHKKLQGIGGLPKFDFEGSPARAKSSLLELDPPAGIGLEGEEDQPTCWN